MAHSSALFALEWEPLNFATNCTTRMGAKSSFEPSANDGSHEPLLLARAFLFPFKPKCGLNGPPEASGWQFVDVVVVTNLLGAGLAGERQEVVKGWVTVQANQGGIDADEYEVVVMLVIGLMQVFEGLLISAQTGVGLGERE